MNTARNLLRATVGILVSGVFAATTLAGPTPQAGNRPATAPAPKAETPNTAAPLAAKCDGCQTTPIWVSSNRDPAGKGVPSARVVGSTHSCARCAGTVATQNGKVRDGMTHEAGCGPLLCCK